MRHISFCLFIIFLTILSGLSQQKETQTIRVLFRGIVMDAKTLAPLPNSQIWRNKTFSSVSDKDGIFSFYVNVHDTLIFRNLGYMETTMIVSDTLIGREYMAGIFMKSDTLAIGEVVIIPRMINIKSEILNSKSKIPETMDNARYNVAVSGYQGRNTTGNLGDPSSNYELLRHRQTINAYERGGIPSDRILGLSPFMIIPAAYLLLHGLPEKPPPMKTDMNSYELDKLQKIYLEKLKSNP